VFRLSLLSGTPHGDVVDVDCCGFDSGSFDIQKAVDEDGKIIEPSYEYCRTSSGNGRPFNLGHSITQALQCTPPFLMFNQTSI